MSERSVSLSDELHSLFKTVEGARVLVEHVIHSPDDEPRYSTQVAHSVVAILVMLTERIRLLDRIVRGTIDPQVIACRQNEALPIKEGDEDDVVLTAWSTRSDSTTTRPN